MHSPGRHAGFLEEALTVRDFGSRRSHMSLANCGFFPSVFSFPARGRFSMILPIRNLFNPLATVCRDHLKTVSVSRLSPQR